MSGYVFPTDKYSENDVSIATVPKAFIPFFRRLWEILQDRDTWYDRESWFRGYQTAAWLEEMLMTATLGDLVEGQRQIYRLIDTIFNGAQYGTVGDPPIVSPEIPIVPDGNDYDLPGLRKQLLDAQGIINAGWFGIGGRPATLADLAEAMKGANNADKGRVLGLLDALNAGSSAATIFETVKGLFMDGEELVTDGAVLGTLIASAVANAALMGAQAAQIDTLVSKIDRLISSIDGGGNAPAGNVVGELVDIHTLLS